jgi:haloalkane dehalogenase
VAANTAVHTADPGLAGRLAWACHAGPDGTVTLEQMLLDYQRLTQELTPFRPSLFVQGATASDVPDPVLAAYDAPFPDESYKEGARQFPMLVPCRPDDPASEANRRAWEVLRQFDKPFLCAFSDRDPITRGADQLFLDTVPGALGQNHTTITGAGHFLQEDKGHDLASAVIDFVHLNTSP